MQDEHLYKKCAHCRHGFNQPCLTLLTSCIWRSCDNYITTKVNVTPNQQLFTINIKLWHIWSWHLYPIFICTTHQNIYDLHVMAYNFMYFFNTHFLFIHINNKKHKQRHTHPRTYTYKHIQPHIHTYIYIYT